MAERMINLPDDVWDKLRDLQQELDEGYYLFICVLYI